MNDQNDSLVLDKKNKIVLSESKIQIDEVEKCLLSLFRICLFKNINPDEKSIKNTFAHYFDLLFKKEKNKFMFKINFLFSYNFFKNKIIDLIEIDINLEKNNWLILNCNINDVYELDSFSSKNYFQNLENIKLLKYLNNYNSHYQSKNFILKEYRKFRNHFLLSLLKVNKNPFLLWVLIFFCFLFFIFIAAKDNSFTFEQQIRNWVHFILEKT